MLKVSRRTAVMTLEVSQRIDDALRQQSSPVLLAPCDFWPLCLTTVEFLRGMAFWVSFVVCQKRCSTGGNIGAPLKNELGHSYAACRFDSRLVRRQQPVLQNKRYKRRRNINNAGRTRLPRASIARTSDFIACEINRRCMPLPGLDRCLSLELAKRSRK